MRDRLAALKAARQTDEYASEYDDHVVEFKGDFMSNFFQEVDAIRNTIQEITQNIHEVRKKHSAILSAAVPDEQVNSELEMLMNSIKRSANSIRSQLKVMEQRIQQDAQEQKVVNADTRIRKAQHTALSRDFVDVMTEYNTIQVDYREKCKGRIQRQLEITGKSKTSEEVEDMIEKKNIAIFTSGIIIETQQARQALGDIEARHKDILNLENSIKELHEMFLDMAMLVESQGEMVDRIEFNVDQAADYVQSAKIETKKAVRYQSKARRKKIIIFFCCIILLAIIGGIVASQVA